MESQGKAIETGIEDIKVLLQSMNPILHDATYYILPECPQNVGKIVWQGIEDRGTTFIIETDGKISSEQYGENWRMITLGVHSSLNAVGFLSAILTPLAEHGISVNVLSGFYHDHLLIKEADVSQCIELLNSLSNSA